MSMLLFLISMIFMFFHKIFFFEFEFMNLNSLSVSFSLIFDWKSLIFMSLVLLISSLVLFYSGEYMEMEKNFNRFIILVVLFVYSMIFLILSPNLISILLGWDGLGLVSYCLVIYYQNIKSFNAGMLTALSNRVGDVMLLLAIAWMLNYGNWNFIFYLNFYFNDFEMKIIGILVMIAAMTKSAQIPFSSWLPAAMAAPTPVSALVHSSTLVTAGVYLLIRFNLLIYNNLMFYLFYISVFTMFMSGLGANFEFDLKKIIALSTLSQLGMMMSILSMGEYDLAFFHLLIHALFKALLFMCAGFYIHSFMNFQDIRYMGSVFKSLPLICLIFNLSNLSLCGFPFFSGFYSKDMILEFYFSNSFNFFMFFVYYFSIGLTVSYSFRLSFFLMKNMNFSSLNLLKENYFFMVKSKLLMIFIVIFSGSLLNWMIFDISYLFMLTFFQKVLVSLMIIMGVFLGKMLFEYKLSYISLMPSNMKLFSFFSLMWNMPFLSTFGVNFYFLKLGSSMEKYLEKGWLENFGSQNLYNYIKSNSVFMNLFYYKKIKIFLLLFIYLMILIMCIYLNSL
uniref:NADH-ubiquinone oxidoreductase chain 5 n=1 Tax=Nephaspis sp. DPP-2018 TaxID=2136114 RepID=A0A343YVM4_9CUCU|nr:NADH dehydrogenase subunit 5 [Nephaspis sp. DPP-2018]